MDAKAVIQEAFEQQIRVMYTVLLEALIMPNANKEEACQRFKIGLRLAKSARDLAIAMVAGEDL